MQYPDTKTLSENEKKCKNKQFLTWKRGMFSTSGPRRSQRKLQVPNLDRVLFASKQRRRHVQDSVFPGTDLKNIYIIIKKNYFFIFKKNNNNNNTFNQN